MKPFYRNSLFLPNNNTTKKITKSRERRSAFPTKKISYRNKKGTLIRISNDFIIIDYSILNFHGNIFFSMIKFGLRERKLSNSIQKKKKNVFLKLDLFKHDIDPENNLDVAKIENNLTILFNKIQNIKPQDLNISHDYGEANILKDIVNGIHDNHDIILEISRKYSPSKLYNLNLKLPTQNRQSKILCLIPLVRSQVEDIYTISLLL